MIRPGQPGYRQCATCLMDTTDPWISFDHDGRCNHCLKMDEARGRWDPAGDPAALERLAARIRQDGKGRDYDVIIGLSGGVDSSYLVHQARQLGLRVLVGHVDTGWNSELAVKNIEQLVTKCGFDLFTHVVDWEEMRDLQHAFFKSGVPNQDIPQDHAIVAGFYNFAARSGIRWAFSGSNLACEGILPPAWGYDNKDVKHIRAIHKRFGTRPLRNFPLISVARRVYNETLLGLRIATPLNLIAYSKAHAIATLECQYGWRYYGGKHYESRFTKFFQAWYLPTKWGYDKRLAHLSSLVVSGQISRAEALREFEAGSLPHEDIESDKDYMARKLDISRKEFDDLMTVPNTIHSAYVRTSPRLIVYAALARAAHRRLLRR